ncbi:uncharacterized protein LOC105274499 [Ooceraea biroi]|uniref:uncharacterized protein LOC105274499 n=1 Tax=Ooceraea biroi TaxID=2015173 RepID=UPI000F09705A|nr:uncharacterized protein LOC105274499 [Ooceraea biroi]
MKGWIKRDEEGKIIVDSNGLITIACEDDDMAFQLHLSEVEVKGPQLSLNVNGKDVDIDIYPWDVGENDSENDKVIETDAVSIPSTSKGGNAVFPWCDSSTKIFLREYKLKRELVKNRKLKNMKLAYQEISQSLQDNGFNVSPLQVENRFKTLKRAYKNMMIHNRRNGRGKYICSYEQDLDEIFSAKDLLGDLEMNGEEFEAEHTKSTRGQNTLVRNATYNIENVNSLSKSNTNKEQCARLETQHLKIIDSLQSCQRALKNLITKMDNRSKSSNDVQHKILQMCMEIRDMHKEAYARAEEQRQKANLQMEIGNTLLEEILTTLKTKKET